MEGGGGRQGIGIRIWCCVLSIFLGEMEWKRDCRVYSIED